MGKLFLGILGALGNSYSMLQSTNKGLEKSLPGGGATKPLGFICPTSIEEAIVEDDVGCCRLG